MKFTSSAGSPASSADRWGNNKEALAAGIHLSDESTTYNEEVEML